MTRKKTIRYSFSHSLKLLPWPLWRYSFFIVLQWFFRSRWFFIIHFFSINFIFHWFELLFFIPSHHSERVNDSDPTEPIVCQPWSSRASKMTQPNLDFMGECICFISLLPRARLAPIFCILSSFLFIFSVSFIGNVNEFARSHNFEQYRVTNVYRFTPLNKAEIIIARERSHHVLCWSENETIATEPNITNHCFLLCQLSGPDRMQQTQRQRP